MPGLGGRARPCARLGLVSGAPRGPGFGPFAARGGGWVGRLRRCWFVWGVPCCVLVWCVLVGWCGRCGSWCGGCGGARRSGFRPAGRSSGGRAGLGRAGRFGSGRACGCGRGGCRAEWLRGRAVCGPSGFWPEPLPSVAAPTPHGSPTTGTQAAPEPAPSMANGAAPGGAQPAPTATIATIHATFANPAPILASHVSRSEPWATSPAASNSF